MLQLYDKHIITDIETNGLLDTVTLVRMDLR